MVQSCKFMKASISSKFPRKKICINLTEYIWSMEIERIILNTVIEYGIIWIRGLCFVFSSQVNSFWIYVFLIFKNNHENEQVQA